MMRQPRPRWSWQRIFPSQFIAWERSSASCTWDNYRNASDANRRGTAPTPARKASTQRNCKKKDPTAWKTVVAGPKPTQGINVYEEVMQVLIHRDSQPEITQEANKEAEKNKNGNNNDIVPCSTPKRGRSTPDRESRDAEKAAKRLNRQAESGPSEDAVTINETPVEDMVEGEPHEDRKEEEEKEENREKINREEISETLEEVENSEEEGQKEEVDGDGEEEEEDSTPIPLGQTNARSLPSMPSLEPAESDSQDMKPHAGNLRI